MIVQPIAGLRYVFLGNYRSSIAKSQVAQLNSLLLCPQVRCELWSIVMSTPVCPSARISQKPHSLTSLILSKLPLAWAAWLGLSLTAFWYVTYVLPVLWMMSRFRIMGLTVRYVYAYNSPTFPFGPITSYRLWVAERKKIVGAKWVWGWNPLPGRGRSPAGGKSPQKL